MITEDYVSFEVAKLLKEKGFDEITFTWYTEKGKFCVGKNNYDDYHMNHFSNIGIREDKGKCSAPTQQMAMRWLREEKNIFIDVYYDSDIKGYLHSIIKLPKGITLNVSDLADDTYEEACEAAIKYYLEHLIK